MSEIEEPAGQFPLADCSVFTEPGLFAFENDIYLVAHCLVISGNDRDPSEDRLILLKQNGTSYRYVAQLTDSADAQQFGAHVLTQPDISIARNGSVILLMTPKILGADPEHQDCVVVAFSDFVTGTLQRAATGLLVERAIITAEGNGLEPGLCT